MPSKDSTIPRYAELIEEEGQGAFFTIANARLFAFDELTIEQNNEIESSCAGICWESAFALIAYLRRFSTFGDRRGGKALELGSGCGLLGLCAAKEFGFEEVVLTDTREALSAVTERNVERNRDVVGVEKARVMALDWENEEELDDVVKSGPYEVVFGTDVVFSKRLVGPLLRCVERCLSKDRPSVCYICIQKRSPDAHRRFVKMAGKVFEVKKVSKDQFSFAEDDECEIFELRFRAKDAHESRRKVKKEKKRKREG